jgi:predicted enzyme related to lactoylglutathione lyase
MSKPELKFNFVLLYVSDPLASAAFYSKLLGRPTIEAAPTFSMLSLTNEVMLGLWLKQNVLPPVVASSGGNEIAFGLAKPDDVRTTFAEWTKLGLTIAQQPTEMDFGLTFVALDPDGNRLRVFAGNA